jgi:glycine cleavage system transcriptional repressor
MNAFLVITVTCPDRPGIVEQVTEVVVAHGGNWEASRMTRLGGEFAGIVLVSIVAQHADALAESLRGMTDDRMTVMVKRTQLPALEAVGTNSYQFRLTGADHEGIVHTVASYLASRGINVEDMETDVEAAPITASPLFRMSARLDVPEQVPLERLRADLADIGEELGVDIEITADE